MAKRPPSPISSRTLTAKRWVWSRVSSVEQTVVFSSAAFTCGVYRRSWVQIPPSALFSPNDERGRFSPPSFPSCDASSSLHFRHVTEPCPKTQRISPVVLILPRDSGTISTSLPRSHPASLRSTGWKKSPPFLSWKNGLSFSQHSISLRSLAQIIPAGSLPYLALPNHCRA